MKKIFLALLMPSFLALASLPNKGIDNSYTKSEAISYEKQIYIDPGFFIDFDSNAGNLASADATFWNEGYAFNSLSTFFRGEAAEGWTGTLVSRAWTQYTQYVYFSWSGQNNSDNVNLRFFYEGCVEPIVIKNTAFVGNPMMLWYAKIPDSAFNPFNGEGFEMHVELYDNATSDYGFNNFGYLHINQTAEEVSDAMRYFLNHLRAPIDQWEIDRHKEILNHYYNNGYLRELFLKTVDNADEDFESGETFTNHWYLDHNYDNNDSTPRYIDGAISFNESRPGTNMPFNKTGNGFFKGWAEEGGYTATDGAIYRFKSRPFVLKDTGLVSIKMAGRSASLHVIDTDTQTDLAWIDIRSFNGEGDENNIALSGKNTVTMVRHIINLEKFVGKTIQLAIADIFNEGWAASYFDELITHYETYPTFKVDVVSQTVNENTTYSYYFDKYISSSHIDNDPIGVKYSVDKAFVTDLDETPICKAYKKLCEFYDVARNVNHGFNFNYSECNALKAFADGLEGLDEDTLSILNNSQDLVYDTSDLEKWYESQPSTSSKVETAINAIKEKLLNCITISFNSNGGTGEMANVVIDKTMSYKLPECSFTPPEELLFDYWLVGEEHKQPGEEISASFSVEVKAIYRTYKDCTVSFKVNDCGTGEMESVTVYEGHEYVLPECGFETANSSYYNFDYWLVGEEHKQPGDVIVVLDDMTITAIFGYFLIYTFRPNGGEGEPLYIRVNNFTDFIFPECPFTPPEGKVFYRWSGGFKPGSVSSGPHYGNATYDAMWRDEGYVPEYYTVTFDANGGTGEMESLTFEENEYYVLPQCPFEAPEGYRFSEWSVNGTSKRAGDYIKITSDMVIKACWAKIPGPSCNITFNGNGGTYGNSNLTIEQNTEYTLPESRFTPPENKKFDHWLIGGQVKHPGDVIVVTSDINIKAMWRDYYTFEITFTSNGGTGEMDNLSIKEDETYYLPECTFTAPEGKEFDGWIVNDGEIRSVGYGIKVISNIELKPNWEAIPTHNVSFNSDGGLGVMESITLQDGEEYELPDCTFTAPEGKEFDGWLINDQVYQPGASITITSDLEIKAIWKDVEVVITTYEVTFNSNGGSGTMETLTINENEELVLPTCTFTAPEGKEFDGWLVNGTKLNPGEKITITSNTEVKATWKVVVDPTPIDPEPQPEQKSGGCGGSILASSALLSLSALSFLGLLFIKRKQDKIDQ